MEANNLSNTEYKKKKKSYKDAQGTWWTFNSTKKNIETIKKSEMKNVIIKINNTLEGINCRLDEVAEWIKDLENKIAEKKPQIE